MKFKDTKAQDSWSISIPPPQKKISFGDWEFHCLVYYRAIAKSSDIFVTGENRIDFAIRK